MTSHGELYNVEQEIASFFSKTSVSRETCDAVAKDLVGGDRAVQVAIQGCCSYTVYAGQHLDHVVQFQLKSSPLKTDIAALARQIYGSLAPETSFKQQLGKGSAEAWQEPLLVYVMARVKEPSRLEFTLAHGNPENSPENKAWRMNLIRDVARFFALSWNAPQALPQELRHQMMETWEKELRMLLVSLPERFHTTIRDTLASLPRILSNPMVLVHGDFSVFNIMTEPVPIKDDERGRYVIMILDGLLLNPATRFDSL
ncbi:hypothetical protein ACRE_076550 [Hapsidospora chrysogenum ATCC 11550]|uniref:Aminoglycoside phosphotransferase domain-containing protein n=1 Tax=Hapsidospora chrysogenum (strain ATCC 11550 / CBS 779.69 / DSM 880 / IAM 14645 / JCM 23072 / IMI 49137) TaxID=857340 RepID=A0A086SWY8_HAPC1|nr:hypothetical protein ACRE_076550 [Hapsidospora chrysogenum ATCC 11550]